MGDYIAYGSKFFRARWCFHFFNMSYDGSNVRGVIFAMLPFCVATRINLFVVVKEKSESIEKKKMIKLKVSFAAQFSWFCSFLDFLGFLYLLSLPILGQSRKHSIR